MHQIPVTSTEREYQMVDELPYGKQAQTVRRAVDFGEYNMRSPSGTRAKVFFFTIILARSMFKYVWFTDRYFTSELAILAHEKAFEYIEGVLTRSFMIRIKYLSSAKTVAISFLQPHSAPTPGNSLSLFIFAENPIRKVRESRAAGAVENLVKYINRIAEATKFPLQSDLPQH